METIKVSSRSVPKAVAGAIAAVLRTDNTAEVQAVGAGAVNQAVKAIAIARMYLHEEDKEVACAPYFSELDVSGTEKTGLSFKVFLM
ncbi:MAG: stage V sporulation protein S [Bacteroides sp.]|nr:stage V sporulation protein S [Eubacterium sp.]MCM1418304.1 stage V sporulation protein S [Roseburia sp.]MCM1462407.1 stage V sporulation protein S [Bacteroides sp.]